MDFSHDLGQPVVGLLEAPTIAAGVLLHFESRGGHPSGVRGLAGRKQHASLLKHPDHIGRGRHIGAFRDRDHAVLG